MLGSVVALKPCLTSTKASLFLVALCPSAFKNNSISERNSYLPLMTGSHTLTVLTFGRGGRALAQTAVPSGPNCQPGFSLEQRFKPLDGRISGVAFLKPCLPDHAHTPKPGSQGGTQASDFSKLPTDSRVYLTQLKKQDSCTCLKVILTATGSREHVLGNGPENGKCDQNETLVVEIATCLKQITSFLDAFLMFWRTRVEVSLSLCILCISL